jgi:hypothetical protein
VTNVRASVGGCRCCCCGGASMSDAKQRESNNNNNTKSLGPGRRVVSNELEVRTRIPTRLLDALLNYRTQTVM